MADIIQRRPATPSPLVWLAIWVSVVLEFGCLYGIPLFAVHHPSRFHGRPILPPDWRTPLLLVALFASVTTWQTWSEQKSGKKRRKPTKPVDAATRRRQNWTVGLVLAVPLLLLECVWVFAMPGTRVDWPVLIMLNVGCVTGVLCFLWANGQLTVARETAASVPVAPPVAVAPVTASAADNNTDPTWYVGNQTALSENAISGLAFLGCLAIVVLAFTPGCATFMSHGPIYWPLVLFFGSMGAGIAACYTFLFRKSRRDGLTRFALTQDRSVLKETPKGAAGYYISFLVIGVMFAIVDFSRTDWGLFALCNAGEFAAFLLLRWTLSRPPTVRQDAAPPPVDWLPKAGGVRATPTEIVLAAPWGLRAFIGGFGLVMAGMTVMCLLLAFAPGLFDPHAKHHHSAVMTVMPLVLFVGMAFFTTLIAGGAGPRDLRLELELTALHSKALEALDQRTKWRGL